MKGDTGGRIATWMFLLVYLILALAAAGENWRPERAVPLAAPLADFPASIGNWRLSSCDSLDPETLALLRPTDYLLRSYHHPRFGDLTLYLGYHGGGGSGEIHSPRNCLPGAGWQRISQETVQVQSEGTLVSLEGAVYGKGAQRELILYWFRVGGENLCDEYLVRLRQLRNALLYRRRDAAFIRISLPGAATGEQQLAALQFAAGCYPQLCRFLPKGP